MELAWKQNMAGFRYVSDYVMLKNDTLNQIDYLGLVTTLQLQAPILIARAVAARNLVSLQIWIAGLGGAGVGATRLGVAVQNSMDRIAMEEQAVVGATQTNATPVLIQWVRSGKWKDALDAFNKFRNSPGAQVIKDEVEIKVVQLADKTNITLRSIEKVKSVCAHTLEINPPQLLSEGERLEQSAIKLRFFPDGVPSPTP